MTKNGFMVASFDPDKVADLIRQCARQVILPLHGRIESHHIEIKRGDPNNKVTVADREAEEFLTEKLKALLPGSYVVGEEACEDHPEIMDYLDDPQKVTWVIDPIDGTGNYARGSEVFCVMVALVAEGERQMGWIYDAVNDSMAFAHRGRGAFIDGQKTSIDAQTAGRTGYTGSRMMDRVDTIRLDTLRCSGLEYFRMAKGEALFSIYRNMKPWDHLAGTLLVEEAGGVVRQWDGSQYDPSDYGGGLISAASEEVWKLVRRSIPEKVLKKAGLAP